MSQNHDLVVSQENALWRNQKPRIIVSATGRASAIPASPRTVTYVSNLGAAGAATFPLPAAEKGMRVRAIVQVAQALRLDPNLTETIALASGVQQAAGKYVTCATIGAYFHLICLVDGKWDVEGFNGTWTAEA